MPRHVSSSDAPKARRRSKRLSWSDVERRVARVRAVLEEAMPADIAAERANNAALALMAADEGGDTIELRRTVVYLTLGDILDNTPAMRGRETLLAHQRQPERVVQRRVGGRALALAVRLALTAS